MIKKRPSTECGQTLERLLEAAMEILFLNRTAVSLLDPFNYSPKYSSSHKHYYEMSKVQGERKYHQPNEREDVNDQSGLPATQQQQQNNIGHLK